MKLLLIVSVLLVVVCIGTEAQNCKKLKCPKNELSSCCADCPQRYCNQADVKVKCPATCKPGCICRAGYVRNNKTNMCVPIESCPKTP
ncbi:venom serine protease inhibitor-like [Anopheles nili]|uniref:venom serine protease inhibitor-like n=1 Tax=Anopheles nili TaxID=185578 RepID=UPI00237C17D1|nr:venom serine protease inhibitor-like [Anopheles nili]